ncbi:glycosyltransferase family 4 protein [Serratia proteamaculans]|uniref:glycosyltransferase family 4 protein n=1 Tax=Serratia proteamaculans TaxID=28151 RepID=UPI0039AF83A0
MNNLQDDNLMDETRRFVESFKQESIFFIFPSKITGGHEIMAVEIIKKIRSQVGLNTQKIVCYLPEDNVNLINKLNLNSIEFKLFKANGSKPEFLHALFNPFYLYRCAKVIREFPSKNKIILVQGDILQGVGFLVTGKLLTKKIISYIPYSHSFKKMGAKSARLKDYFAGFFYTLCDQYITISKCFKQDIELKNKKSKVSLLHNFVNEVALSDRFIERKFNSNDVINIFIIGRVQFHQKGHDILINALSGITEYNIALHVVGDGPDLQKLKAKQDKLPENISLICHGWVAESWHVAKEFNIDLLVIPSLFEGVPLVMLEAKERHVPIIAAGRDGMLDCLPAHSLYAVSGDEVTALRDKILYHIQNRLV